MTRTPAVWLAVAGLLTAPLAAISCEVGNAAAMACCQGDMSDCNEPGQTEDCCRVSLGDPQTAVAAAPTADTRDTSSTLLSWAPTVWALAPEAAPSRHAHLSTPATNGSPPRSPVLRL